MKRKIIVGIIVVFLMGFIFGIINKISISNELLIKSFYFYLNLSLYLIVYGLAVVGLPTLILIMVYEVFTSGFITITFFYNFGLKSFLFFLGFFIYKALIIFFHLLNSFYYCKYVKHLVGLILKKGLVTKRNTYLYLKKMTIITGITILLMLIYYFLITKLTL